MNPLFGRSRAGAAACLIVILLSGLQARATTFTFTTDPFLNSTALTTPGRQIVGGEDFITFNVATDEFAFASGVFGITSIGFASSLAANLAATGLNVVVLQDLDNDANPASPFAAGTAANLIADQITSPGPGFFVYFNSGLQVPRLVYSTDLSDNTADLKVLARLTNLNSAALPGFTAANFRLLTVPDGESPLTLALSVLFLMAARHIFWRRGVRG